MNEITIGSLWVSRNYHEPQTRIIIDITLAYTDEPDVFLIMYHDVTRGHTASVIASYGEWMWDWQPAGD